MLAGPVLYPGNDEPPGVGALAAMDPREIIARFDSERDLQMLHHEALAVLRAMRTHESDDLAVRVGTAWAHMQNADLTHLLRDGVAWIDESRRSVALLEASKEASADPFAAYVLARWHATAGRIRFRRGDVKAACIELTAAAKRCTQKELWFCRPDILTNLLRVQIERARPGSELALRTAVRRFSTLREVMNRLAGRRGIDLGAVASLSGELAQFLNSGGTGGLGVSRERLADVIGICDARESRRRCEMLRGLVTLHLGRALLLAPNPDRRWAGDRERSRELAWWCARVAFAVGDRHRLGHALRHLTALDA